MELEVGKNSYATAEEATQYIAVHYPVGDAQRMVWEAINTADQEACLRQAAGRMDGLWLRGYKKEKDQPLDFPRCTRRSGCGGCGDCVGVDRAAMAQIEEALELAAPGEDSERHALISGAVRSFRMGSFSESYRHTEYASPEAALASRAAQWLLRPYVEGCYEIR